MMASMGNDWALRLWDARTGQDMVTTVGRHRVMRFSRDGRRLSTAPTDRELAILERAPETVFREFQAAPAEAVIPSRLMRSADGRFLLAVHPQLRVFDTTRAAEITTHNSPAALGKQAFFERDEAAIFYHFLGEGIFRRAFVCCTNGADDTVSLQWGEAKMIAGNSNAITWDIVEEGEAIVRQDSEGAELWSQRKPSQMRRVGIRGPLPRLSISQNMRWAAAPDSTSQHATVWDCEGGQVLTNLPAQGVEQVWFSPDSRWLVASIKSGYGTWETGTWKPGSTWEARLDSGDPGEVTFSDDSRLVAVRQERETFRLLSFPEGHELVTLKPPLVVPVRSACLSPDGSRLWLLAQGYRLFEWNLAQMRIELKKLGLDW